MQAREAGYAPYVPTEEELAAQAAAAPPPAEPTYAAYEQAPPPPAPAPAPVAEPTYAQYEAAPPAPPPAPVAEPTYAQYEAAAPPPAAQPYYAAPPPPPAYLQSAGGYGPAPVPTEYARQASQAPTKEDPNPPPPPPPGPPIPTLGSVMVAATLNRVPMPRANSGSPDFMAGNVPVWYSDRPATIPDPDYYLDAGTLHDIRMWENYSRNPSDPQELLAGMFGGPSAHPVLGAEDQFVPRESHVVPSVPPPPTPSPAQRPMWERRPSAPGRPQRRDRKRP